MGLPYIVYGIVTDSDDAVVPSTRVTLRNDTNGEKINDTTDSSGHYEFDAANLTSGYLSTDNFTVICSYGLESGETSVSVSDSEHEADISLSETAESSDLNYCQVQDVLDELGDKTTSDISYSRVRKIILRSEAEIEERSGTKFKSTTETNEIHNFDQYTSWKSPDQLRGYSTTFVTSTRNDHWNTYYNNRIKLKHAPVISITSLYKNSAGNSSTDNWVQLTEQTGTGGDFLLDKNTGIITFVKDVPNLGARSMKCTYVYGHSTVPKTVERLCILMSVRDVITSKGQSSQFDDINNISIEGLSVSNGITASISYLKFLNEEIDRLFKIIGEFEQHVA